VAPSRYVLWRDGVDAFETIALYRSVSFNVAIGADARQVEGFQVDDRFFPMLGVRPAIGRGFTADDARPGGDAVALLTDGFWRRQFGADPAVVGHVITIDGAPCTVLGVLPPTFRIYHVLNQELQVFRPLVLDPSDRAHSLNVYATLKPGVSIDAAREQLAARYVDLPGTDGTWSASADRLSDSFANQSRALLLALQWAVALVLLIACANLANLLLAASAGRRKELAVRQALGASPWRLARDLAAETTLLVTAGGAVAIAVAFGVVRVLNAMLSFEDVNRLAPFRVDGWVLAFSGALTVAVAALVGLLPARASVSPDQLEALKDSTHGVTTGLPNRRLRQGLVVAEMALAVVLAASALAIARSAIGLQALDRGLATGGVMTAKVSFNSPAYADADVLARTGTAIAERLAAAPGIAASAIVNYPPLSQIRIGVPVEVEGGAPQPGGEPAAARFWVVSPGYFRAAGIRLGAGRDFTSADTRDPPGVAIVSDAFAQHYWHTTDVIGRHVTAKFSGSPVFWIPRARQGALTIIGVAADVREDPLDHPNEPQLYLPFAQNPTVEITLMARVAEGRRAETALPAMRDAVGGVDAELPLTQETTFDGILREAFARPRETAWLLGTFAALALLLAALGVYGVIAHTTAARTREIGIRMALGASPADVVGLVLRQAVPMTAAGVTIGIALSPAALGFARSLLFGLGPFDVVTLATVAIGLALVSIAAALLPALRAARSASTSFR
jgi:predicted permease